MTEKKSVERIELEKALEELKKIQKGNNSQEFIDAIKEIISEDRDGNLGKVAKPQSPDIEIDGSL
ncbi:MAG: hypothetical protein A2451_11965 [Bdellovibrionales bacterium RIFOXYC2_FULL_39_8]|nr:MAG: hypothetical protein A2451_11965 [Bdellovibrionales bacterium RIFOXYC2_FULL_39_8]